MTEEVKDEDLKLNEHEDGSATIGDEPPKEEPAAEGDSSEGDERVAKSDEEDDEDEHDDSGLSPEEKRERNRKRRAESKAKRKEYIDTLKLELSARDRVINEMSQRLNVVERKSNGSEMAQLDRAEQEAVQAYNHFKDINARAIEQANGQVAIDAQEKMFQARQRFEQLRSIKTQITKKQSAPQPLDPRMVNHAQGWMAKNSWYDPKGTDDDSSIMLTIDNRMAQEGWDPTTAEYWEELENRKKKYLPHRAGSGYNKRESVVKRSAPPVAGSGRESSASGTSTYKLSPERVSALKEAGLWDDPKQRAEAVKRFQQFDKEQRA